MNELGVAARYALDGRPGIWPFDTPGRNDPYKNLLYFLAFGPW
jgi:hypothetical protein